MIGPVRRRALAIGTAIALAATAQTMGAQERLATAPVPTEAIAGDFTLAATGDLIYLRPMLATLSARSPDMLRLLRGADVTFGNFETTVLDMATTKAVAQAESGGTWMLADPRVPKDVAALGFDIVSHANNHATDWGVEGMTETGRRLDEAGLVWAGTGGTLSAARAPRYIDVAQGRVALVSATSTFTPMSRASDAVGDVAGRPGVNALRTVRTALVTPDQFETLAAIAAKSPLRTDGRVGDGVTLFGNRFAAGDAGGRYLEYRYRINATDLAANLRSVRQAKQNGNFVIYSVHNHEPGNDFEEPADFAVELAHAAIDAGADAYMGHGPHQLRGIEIYRGRPIFYSLGNFAMMNNSLDVVPADMYDQFGVDPDSATVPELLQARNARTFSDPRLYESVIALTRYHDGRLSEIRLYPIDLGVDGKGADRGVPRMASRATGDRILARLQKLSAALGTTIRLEDGVGVIRLAPETSRPTPPPSTGSAQRPKRD